ncbi:LOW QUALITY PROTEIN: hypothetical protein CVT26_004414 [Gymnopilus dilepis]|uniref:ATP citrate synthase n=1 Tax=Gymnopilus dilepis TaxID=231916 RepID=A0A409WN82_9AGAR|nr:LOW QUALITY PROTEIN: hypothetical protein CVT26_004414 [Gymnopilus dilepis]
MDSIIASKLYRSGSVGYVPKSGGMSNELDGDRYPGSTFIDHLPDYEQDHDCKMLILLSEVGGIEEYRVVKKGIILKPIVAWAIGTCARMFATEVQFGHAGSLVDSDMESADAKNKAMRDVGFIVPDTFEELPQVLKETYESLLKNSAIKPKLEIEPPVIPMGYKWELSLIHKPAALISTISDERGQELLYAGVRISDVSKEDIGLGGVVRLPPWATEMVLMLTADHDPAVSGAIRAGKDLISSSVSGPLTIGALDQAAVIGIGHKIKSINNLDLCVELLVKEYVRKHFWSHSLLDYSLAVERLLLQRRIVPSCASMAASPSTLSTPCMTAAPFSEEADFQNQLIAHQVKVFMRHLTTKRVSRPYVSLERAWVSLFALGPEAHETKVTPLALGIVMSKARSNGIANDSLKTLRRYP